MASSLDAAGPATLPDAVREDRNDSDVDLDIPRSDHHTSTDSGDASCRWATDEFHHQECARFFDCPTHTIERRLSIDRNVDVTEGAPSQQRNDDLISGNLYEDVESSVQSSSPPHSTHLGSGASTPPLPQQVLEEQEVSPASSGRNSIVLRGATADQHEASPVEPPEDSQSSWAFADSQPDIVSPSATGIAGVTQGFDMQPGPASGIRSADRRMGRDGTQGTEASASRQQRDLYTADPPVQTPARPQQGGLGSSPDLVLPRWQPDAEVTYCPICHTQFSFFVRKHHCRKCGRVVCNSCSPHRIIIPHQYIVRPPGTEMPAPQSLVMDSLGVGYFEVNGNPGGERVRLCNPCVPDPNIAPPQHATPSPAVTSPTSPSPRSSHQRARSSMGNAYGVGSTSNRYGVVFASGQGHDPFQAYAPRSRSIAMNSPAHAMPGPSSSSRNRASIGAFYSSSSRPSGGNHPSTSVPSYPSRYSSLRNAPSSSRQRALPPAPQIAEEDECPICHRELPQRTLPNFEALRESHINNCIQSHSTYGSPRPGSEPNENELEAAPRRTGMYSYPATEKDCIDDAECTICLEEFTVGIPMARLECLCRFHRSCISAWFVNHPGRCPVHQHDGFGY